jgi:hypothetical protein
MEAVNSESVGCHRAYSKRLGAQRANFSMRELELSVTRSSNRFFEGAVLMMKLPKRYATPLEGGRQDPRIDVTGPSKLEE